MRPVVVADSGPLIALASCGQLPLLAALFASVHLPQAVLDETTADLSRPGARDIARFAAGHAQVHPSRHDAIYAQAIAALDEGESQALKNVFTVFSWCPQGSKAPQSRRAPQAMLAAWPRCATTSAALCCLARRVAPQKWHLRRCKCSPGHQPGCALRLASATFAGQRAP